MLDDVLRQAFQLAHRRPGLIFLDLLWKAIWLVITFAALLLVGVWFGSELQSIGWRNTGNRTINSALAFALLRQFWAAHRTEMVTAIATVCFLSLLVWFVLEAAFRSRIRSGRFSTFLLSNVLRCVIVSAAALSLGAICFVQYTRGTALVALVTVAALAFFLTIIDTLIRIDAIDLLGTDLFRVTGLLVILLSVEALISGSCAVLVGVGFLNIAGWRDAVVMLGAAAVALVFMNVLHSYLLLVRFSAVDIMRQNVIEV